MIETRYGNALDVQTGIIVHGCNCQGVMGGGIALEVKNRFPDAYHEYMRVHNARGLKLGQISFAEVSQNKFIVNAQTQDQFGRPGRNVSYDAVADSFVEVVRFATAIREHRNLNLDIIFPAIGAGLGGGDWNVISAMIDAIVPDAINGGFNKVLYIYKP